MTAHWCDTFARLARIYVLDSPKFALYNRCDCGAVVDMKRLQEIVSSKFSDD